MIVSERARVVSVLGIVQIFTWGSTFYLLAVLSAPIAVDTGWATGTITTGVSIALLVSGLTARRVGRMIQSQGGRYVLAGGVSFVATGLTMLGLAHTVPVYLAAWIVIGAGMAGSLYEAAFSTLGRLYGRDARSAITALTLWGGFASTVCWPISAVLVETIGWRGACFAYALLHLSVMLPLCWFALPNVSPGLSGPAKVSPAEATVGAMDLRFWCIAIAGMFLAMLFSIMSVHLITILTAGDHDLSLAAAIGLGALIGPAQVGARVMELMGGGRHHPIYTMIVAVVLVLTGILMLAMHVPAAPALVAFGAGNGLWSIARGALPLEIFGPDSFAVIVGRLATPMLLASAVAPLVGNSMLEEFGPDWTIRALAIGSIIPFASAILLFFLIGRPSRRH